MSRPLTEGSCPLPQGDIVRRSAAEPEGLSGEAAGRTDWGEGVSLETIIRRVTERVVQELAREGIKTVSSGPLQPDAGTRTERVDMGGFKTPVLLEKHVHRLHALTGIVAVPRGTVVSPKAREALRDRNISLRIE